jgi:catechol 2,3-dioxygenase
MNNLSEKTTGTATLPDDLRLGPVHIAVNDLDRSVAFYETSIGLQLHGREDAEARLGAGGEDLLVLHAEPDAKQAGRHAGLYHFALLFPTRQELARAVRRLAETGTSIQGASDHGISEAIYLPDPDGNGIELAADQPRSNWGNLRDPTTIGPAPLDMAGLMATIDGEELSPKADRDLGVGHLHLHVSDIEEALAFYRDVVGFEVQTLFQGAAFVSAGGYHHHLGLNTWRGEGIPPQPGGTVGLRHWTVLVDSGSLGQLRERLQSAGVAVTERNGALEVTDPFGIPLRFAPAS